jgi:hypothetical protein
MSVFISWASEQSKTLAMAVRDLLETAIPSLKQEGAVFVSDAIEKGVNWFDSIIDNLKQSEVGIVCLTPEG